MATGFFPAYFRSGLNWMLPVYGKPTFGSKTPSTPGLIPDGQKVRPTSGLEVVSSRHLPDEVQGDLILCNNIGFLGIKQHQIEDSGTGWKTTFRRELLQSNDGNFRPVALEFAPDCSLYVIDWQNPLIGHMQHNARDPYRDHTHGRVYRITYPSRPLVKPAQNALKTASKRLSGGIGKESSDHKELGAPAHLSAEDKKQYSAGQKVYFRNAHCATCHQPNGKGLDPAFPSLEKIVVSPIAGSGSEGTPSLRTTKTSSGAWSSFTTSRATGTPPRGMPRTRRSAAPERWASTHRVVGRPRCGSGKDGAWKFG